LNLKCDLLVSKFGFNPRTYEGISWFQSLLFKFILCRYSAVKPKPKAAAPALLIKKKAAAGKGKEKAAESDSDSGGGGLGLLGDYGSDSQS
jgi:hypothetical protein